MQTKWSVNRHVLFVNRPYHGYKYLCLDRHLSAGRLQTNMYEGRFKANTFCQIIIEHIEFALIRLRLESQGIYC